MATENELAPIHTDLMLVKELVYDKWGFDLTNFRQHTESAEYNACSFVLNDKTIQYRSAKITPTKTGQFVTIWKRNKDGITEPFDSADDIDFIIITARHGDKLGQFVFSKAVLADKGIITHKGKDGKRGIRVYPTWDTVSNKQAEKTQAWQTKYFFILENDASTELDVMRRLFMGGV